MQMTRIETLAMAGVIILEAKRMSHGREIVFEIGDDGQSPG